MGPGAFILKIDITCAFMQLRIHPGDLDLLGVKHKKYFIDGSLPFEFRHGSLFFSVLFPAY